MLSLLQISQVFLIKRLVNRPILLSDHHRLASERLIILMGTQRIPTKREMPNGANNRKMPTREGDKSIKVNELSFKEVYVNINEAVKSKQECFCQCLVGGLCCPGISWSFFPNLFWWRCWNQNNKHNFQYLGRMSAVCGILSLFLAPWPFRSIAVDTSCLLLPVVNMLIAFCVQHNPPLPNNTLNEYPIGPKDKRRPKKAFGNLTDI